MLKLSCVSDFPGAVASPCLVLTMPIDERICVLQSKVSEGFSVSVSLLPNLIGNKFKVKCIVKSADVIASPFLVASSLAALEVVKTLAQGKCVVDRGHVHSDGSYEACFWISERAVSSAQPSADKAASLSAVPTSPSAVPTSSSAVPTASSAVPTASSAVPTSSATATHAQLGSRVCLIKGPHAGSTGTVTVSSGKLLSIVLDDAFSFLWCLEGMYV